VNHIPRQLAQRVPAATAGCEFAGGFVVHHGGADDGVRPLPPVIDIGATERHVVEGERLRFEFRFHVFDCDRPDFSVHIVKVYALEIGHHTVEGTANSLSEVQLGGSLVGCLTQRNCQIGSVVADILVGEPY